MNGMNVLDASKMIVDEYTMKILAGTFKSPKTAQELSTRFKIPIAVCYRKIHDLETYGLLECVDKILTQDGRRVKIFRSQLKSAYVFFEKGKLRVHLDLVNIPKIDFDETMDVLEVMHPV